MLVLSNTLTIGQITFILRGAIQILAYGGLFLLGLLILANSPRVATFETHDVINRVVGKSTATTTSVKWIFKRMTTREHRNVPPSCLLVCSLALWLVYGLFVSLSDVGFLGLNACEVPSPTRIDSPASVRSDDDARTALQANLLQDVDPGTVRSYMCDSAQEHPLDDGGSIRICTSWRNSTFADPTQFRSLNSTNSDVLMPRSLSHYEYPSSARFDLNSYYVGVMGEGVRDPIIQNGLAVIPHDTGVRMLVGVPTLSRKEKVHIPSTLAVEVEMGCMPIGTMGQKDVSAVRIQPSISDFFVPDDLFQANWTGLYAGPENLRVPLLSAVNHMRDLVRPTYNSTNVNPNGFWIAYNETLVLYDWLSSITDFIPHAANGTALITENLSILRNCTADIRTALGASPLPPGVNKFNIADACGAYQMLGSVVRNQTVYQRHYEMMCATSTSVDMVSTTLEVDSDGQVSNPEVTRLPSDLNIGYADYFDMAFNGENVTYGLSSPLVRFTLSPNPAGASRHYIPQWTSIATTPSGLELGAGTVGYLLTLVGSAILGVSRRDQTTIGIINTTYFSTDFTPRTVTRWAGSVGASYILSSIGYNPWAARGMEGTFEVQSTGGKSAACYDVRYAAGFLPLVLAALVVFFWTVAMVVTSKLKGTKRWEGLYGGLAPVIVSPVLNKPTKGEVLAWQEGDEPHLRPVYSAMPLPSTGAESQVLISPHYKTEYEAGSGVSSI